MFPFRYLLRELSICLLVNTNLLRSGEAGFLSALQEGQSIEIHCKAERQYPSSSACQSVIVYSFVSYLSLMLDLSLP